MPDLLLGIFLHPLILVEFAIGFVVGVVPSWDIQRILTWVSIPPIFGIAFSVIMGLSGGGWVAFWMGVLLYIPAGILAYGSAMLLGFLFRKALKIGEPKTKNC